MIVIDKKLETLKHKLIKAISDKLKEVGLSSDDILKLSQAYAAIKNAGNNKKEEPDADNSESK